MGENTPRHPHTHTPTHPHMNLMGFAIIGCGVIAPTHARAIRSIDGARLVACCDLERPRAEKLAADFDIPHAYTDFHELLRRLDVDIVHVVTWSGVHAEQG